MEDKRDLIPIESIVARTPTSGAYGGIAEELYELMAHELGHLLGAEHDPTLPAGFMHPAALAFDPIRYSRKSINEIRRCALS